MKRIVLILCLFFAEIKSIQEDSSIKVVNFSSKLKNCLKQNIDDLADISGLLSSALIGILTFNKTIIFSNDFINMHKSISKVIENMNSDDNYKNIFHEGPSFGTDIIKIIGIILPVQLGIVMGIWANKIASKIVRFAIKNIE